MVGGQNLYKCEVTGWHNNCGASCFVHFIVHKILTDQLSDDSPPGNTDEYKKILGIFGRFYELKGQPTWADMKKLLKKYPSPIDHEAILSPVIRKYISEIMADPNNEASVEYYNHSLVSIIDTFSKDYLQTRHIGSRDIYDLIGEDSLRAFQAKYKEESALALSEIVDASLEEMGVQNNEDTDAIKSAIELYIQSRGDNTKDPMKHLLENKDNKVCLEKSRRAYLAIEEPLREPLKTEISKYQKEIMQRYAQNMGKLSSEIMIDISELTLLTEKLNINRFYNESAGSKQDPFDGWSFKIFNRGAHWEYEHPLAREEWADKKTLQEQVENHNKFYGKVIPDDEHPMFAQYWEYLDKARFSAEELPFKGYLKLFSKEPISEFDIRSGAECREEYIKHQIQQFDFSFDQQPAPEVKVATVVPADSEVKAAPAAPVAPAAPAAPVAPAVPAAVAPPISAAQTPAAPPKEIEKQLRNALYLYATDLRREIEHTNKENEKLLKDIKKLNPTDSVQREIKTQIKQNKNLLKDIEALQELTTAAPTPMVGLIRLFITDPIGEMERLYENLRKESPGISGKNTDINANNQMKKIENLRQRLQKIPLSNDDTPSASVFILLKKYKEEQSRQKKDVTQSKRRQRRPAPKQ
jgi:hypothetical protein